ncbi:MAG: hypothetical protein PHR04_04630 [Syntrophomonadaceae bacterium]|nr:hypothetical protein [Syntrophomonadaceae bacterium]
MDTDFKINQHSKEGVLEGKAKKLDSQLLTRLTLGNKTYSPVWL